MGFWEQMNSDSIDRRRSYNKPSIPQPEATDYTDPAGIADDIPNDEFSLEEFLSQWDMCNIDPDHPEWLEDPEFLKGFAMIQVFNMDALEYFGNAVSNGNILALVAIGDFFYRMLEFTTMEKRYRYGTYKNADGWLKSAMRVYVMAMMHDAYFEKMQERLLMLRHHFLHEHDFMEELEAAGEALNELSFDNPEEFKKIFSL